MPGGKLSDRGNPALPAQSEYGGNPLRYGGWNFDWQKGRELVKAELSDGAADTTLTYAYDADGIRTSKTYKVETYEAHYTVKFVADGVIVKTMTVNDGYTLTDSDYPTVPTKAGHTAAWQQYTEAIHADITMNKLALMFEIAPRLADAYRLKNEFLNVIRSDSAKAGKQKLIDWLTAVEVMDLPEFSDCTKAYRNWFHEILNSMDVPWSNGFIEGCNNKTKVLKRVCFGMRNFSNFRKRILFCHA